jgi:hypothetical protein
MPDARYEWSGYGGRTAYWPFLPPDAAPTMAAIAPEFRANFERILSTSRFYLRIDSGDGRNARARRRARRR